MNYIFSKNNSNEIKEARTRLQEFIGKISIKPHNTRIVEGAGSITCSISGLAIYFHTHFENGLWGVATFGILFVGLVLALGIGSEIENGLIGSWLYELKKKKNTELLTAISNLNRISDQLHSIEAGCEISNNIEKMYRDFDGNLFIEVKRKNTNDYIELKRKNTDDYSVLVTGKFHRNEAQLRISDQKEYAFSLSEDAYRQIFKGETIDFSYLDGQKDNLANEVKQLCCNDTALPDKLAEI